MCACLYIYMCVCVCVHISVISSRPLKTMGVDYSHIEYALFYINHRSSRLYGYCYEFLFKFIL